MKLDFFIGFSYIIVFTDMLCDITFLLVTLAAPENSFFIHYNTTITISFYGQNHKTALILYEIIKVAICTASL